MVRDKSTGRFFLGDEGIITLECSGPGIILDEFQRTGHSGIVHGSVHDASRLVARKVLGGRVGKHVALSLVRDLLSGLGYGIAFLSEADGGIEATIMNPPVTQFGPLWQVWELEGFLSAALEQSVSAGPITTSTARLMVRYRYR